MKSRGAVLAVILLIAFAYSFSATAQKKNVQVPLGSSNIQKPLEVKGQTRNISMMVTTQANKDKLNFVTSRKNFRSQILTTKY